jgi:hypothetical protein
LRAHKTHRARVGLAGVCVAALLAGCGGSATVGSTTAPLKLKAAAHLVSRRGYFAADASAYRPGAPLSAIIGVRKSSGDGTAQRAFFFAGGKLVGTDARDDSSGIRVAFVKPSVIGLTYALYNPRDPQCCPRAGAATVPFRWDGERVVPERPLPPSSFSARSSRR